MLLIRICFLSLFLLVSMTIGAGSAGAESTGQLRVVTSIKPVHSLVSAVMADTGQPDLILDSASSPHGYILKPSKAGLLAKADIIFWIGPSLEAFLQKPVKTIGSSAISVELAKADGLKTLPFREIGPDKHSDTAEAHDHGTVDPHIWLDPQNAKAMVRMIANVLSAADAKNEKTYQANAYKLAKELDLRTDRSKGILTAVSKRPFVTHHDGYQYFERRFGLNSKGALIANPEILPGMGHALKIRDRLKTIGKSCLFTEKQFSQKFVTVMTENTDTKIALLDPLGSELKPGPELYFTLIEQMTNAFYDCLSSLDN